jgi:hypothetical protein
MIPDACPVCPDPPFDRPACPALSVQPSGGGQVTSHECGPCGSTWRTFRDMYGWVIVRAIDPVSAAEAEIHRGIVLEALAEHHREARHADARPASRSAAA